MQTTKLLFVVALGLTVLIARASADDDYHNKDNKGPCKGGFWPDGKGCCPELIHGKPYYRDYLNYCYPKDVGCGVFYADAKSCYPDEKGTYLASGEKCPHERQCKQRCIRPDDDDDCDKTTTSECKTTTEECKTTTEERTTTPRRTTTEECRTTTEERTTTPKRTTTEECKTTTEERTTTPKRTTTEECKTTTEDCRTTSEKPCDDGKCANGQWKDGKGCCPRKIDHQFYYRDFQGCYPIKRDCGVLYADANGCYPDEHGKYLASGDCCPKERQCKPECDGNYH